MIGGREVTQIEGAMAKVIVERRGAVLEIRLNRPELLNAVDREAIAALGAAAAEAAEDRAARVVLFSGEGTHFCAGGDITMFGELVRLPPEERRKVIYETVDALHPLLVRLRHMPKPVVAAVQGGAAGVGLSFVLAADLAIAAEDAVFTCGYVHLGTSPDGAMTALLPAVVGLKQAAELMLLGDRFDAARALALGIVNRVVPPTGCPPRPKPWRNGSPPARRKPMPAPKHCCKRASATHSMRNCAAKPRTSPPAPQPTILSKASTPSSKSAAPPSPPKVRCLSGAQRPQRNLYRRPCNVIRYTSLNDPAVSP